MEPITKYDLEFLKTLNSRTYSNNKIESNTTEKESDEFKNVKLKLKDLSNYFGKKYNSGYGPFKNSISSGNPIRINSTKLK